MTHTPIFRAPNLSFCELDQRVVVLEPVQGLYYILSNRVAAIVRGIPLEGGEGAPASELLIRPMLLKALIQAGLIICPLPAEAIEAGTADDAQYAQEITRWGSVTELTQTGGTGYSGGSGPF